MLWWEIKRTTLVDGGQYRKERLRAGGCLEKGTVFRPMWPYRFYTWILHGAS
jgi:hypothetical protein